MSLRVATWRSQQHLRQKHQHNDSGSLVVAMVSFNCCCKRSLFCDKGACVGLGTEQLSAWHVD